MHIIGRVMLLPFFTAEDYASKLERGEEFPIPDISLSVLRVSAYEQMVVQKGLEDQIRLSTYLGFVEEDRILAKTQKGEHFQLFIQIT